MFWDNFYLECTKKGTSPSAVCKAIGLSNAAATGWKNGTLPKADVLANIANYLGCSADYLIGINQHPEPIAIKAKKDDWIRILNQFSDDDLIKLKSYAEFLLSQKEGENNG